MQALFVRIAKQTICDYVCTDYQPMPSCKVFFLLNWKSTSTCTQCRSHCQKNCCRTQLRFSFRTHLSVDLPQTNHITIFNRSHVNNTCVKSSDLVTPGTLAVLFASLSWFYCNYVILPELKGIVIKMYGSGNRSVFFREMNAFTSVYE